MAQPAKILLAKPRNLSSFLGSHMVERKNLPQMSSDLHACDLHACMCTHEPTRTFNNVSEDNGKDKCQGGLWTFVTNVLRCLDGNMKMMGPFIYTLKPGNVAVLSEAVVCITTMENARDYMLQSPR